MPVHLVINVISVNLPTHLQLMKVLFKSHVSGHFLLSGNIPLQISMLELFNSDCWNVICKKKEQDRVLGLYSPLKNIHDLGSSLLKKLPTLLFDVM